jgi:hypothetical protein
MIQQVRKLLIPIGVLLVIISVVHISSRWLFGTSVFSSSSRDVRNLELTFSIIEQYDVSAYRNQDWCRNIAYRDGQFSETTHPSTCNLFDGPAQSFTPQARSDFQTIRRMLNRSGVRIAFFNIDFHETGRIRYASFNFNCLLRSRPRYVYRPNYGTVPEDIPNEMWFTPINHDWYKVEEDWN